MPFQVMPMGGAPIKKPCNLNKIFKTDVQFIAPMKWNTLNVPSQKVIHMSGFLIFFSKIAVKIGSKIHKSGLVLPFLISKTVKNIYYIQITKIFKTVLLILLFFLLKTFFTNVRWKITTFEFLRKHDKAFCFYINLFFQNRFSSKYLTHKIVVTFF